MAEPTGTRPTGPAADPSVGAAHRRGADIAPTEIGTITPAARKGRYAKWGWIALAAVIGLLVIAWLIGQ